MFIHNAVRALAAFAGAGAALMVGVAAAMASQPMPEPVGRSGIWAPVTPAGPVIAAQDGLTDWVFAALLVLAATATVAVRGHDGVRHA
jgi:hypothetical protein